MKQDQYDNSNGRLNASSLRKLEKEFMRSLRTMGMHIEIYILKQTSYLLWSDSKCD
jgi:hypothetical protein